MESLKREMLAYMRHIGTCDAETMADDFAAQLIAENVDFWDVMNALIEDERAECWFVGDNVYVCAAK